MKSNQTTQMSMKWVRLLGGVPEVVERWRGPVRKDFFGMFDIAVVFPKQSLRPRRMLLIQTTTIGNLRARVKKVSENPLLPVILDSGIDAECHGWGRGRLRRVVFRPMLGGESFSVEELPEVDVNGMRASGLSR